MIITFREPSLHSTTISFSNEASDLLNNFVIEKIAERKTRVNHNYMQRNSTDIPSQLTPPRPEKHSLSALTQQSLNDKQYVDIYHDVFDLPITRGRTPIVLIMDLPYFITGQPWDTPQYALSDTKATADEFLSQTANLINAATDARPVRGTVFGEFGQCAKLRDMLLCRCTLLVFHREATPVFTRRKGHQLPSNVIEAALVIWNTETTPSLPWVTNVVSHPWTSSRERIQHTSPDGSTSVNPTQKPIALVSTLLESLSAGLTSPTVIDVFAGSGTTAAAALRLDLPVLLAEKDPAQREAIKWRLDHLFDPPPLDDFSQQ